MVVTFRCATSYSASTLPVLLLRLYQYLSGRSGPIPAAAREENVDQSAIAKTLPCVGRYGSKQSVEFFSFEVVDGPFGTPRPLDPLAELERENRSVETKLRRLDAARFTAIAYRGGRAAGGSAECDRMEVGS